MTARRVWRILLYRGQERLKTEEDIEVLLSRAFFEELADGRKLEASTPAYS